MKQHSIGQSPKARKDRLIVKELPDETLVYDLNNDKAHCLNTTSSLVWAHCDGQSSVAEIAQVLTAKTNVKVDDAVVWLALDQLQKFNLIDAAP
ncbi:MAG TPA: PqqD family protein, partial [Pyrinomonadaceae bacterium]|nr:PqqD family protein [Pyrinomonadaceae bacterium]